MAGSSLRDYADIVMGQSPAGETCNIEGVGIPLLNGPTEYGSHHPSPVQFTTDARKRARPGDVLFCVRGSTTGRMNWADREYAIGRGVAAIRHKRRSDLQPFVRAVIEYGLPGLLVQATGSTFPNVSADQLAGLWWPPLQEDEQRFIARILGTLDDKIELNRRMSETLEAMARALFKSWFVDFDPVRAKAEGRWKRGQSLLGLPTNLWDLFPARLVDSELGEIPEGWEVGTLGDVLDQRVDRCTPSEETRSRPYVPIECIATRSLLLADSKPGEEAQSSLTKFRKGDLLFGAMRPYFHKVAIAPFDGTTRTTVFVLQPKAPEDFCFSALVLHDPKTIEYATNHSTGSTIPYAVWRGSLEAMPTVLPPRQIRAAFDRLARPFLDGIPPFLFKNRTLAALRDALLPKLISGELRVKGAGMFVGRL